MPTRTLENFQASTGNAQALLNQSGRQAGALAENIPAQNFNIRLMELLKNYQQLGTKPFAEQSFGAQEAQARRVFQGPGNLAGASPTLQSQVRGADVSALQPTVTSAQQSQKTFGEQISGFGDAITRAQGLVQQFEQQQANTRKEARENINFAIESGGSAGLEALLKAQPSILKLSGFDAETIQGLIPSIKKKEEEAAALKKTVSYQDLGDSVGVFDNSGNLLKKIPKGLKPGDEPSGGGVGVGTGTTPDLRTAANNLRALVAKTGPAAKIFDNALNSALARGEDFGWKFLRSQYGNNVLSGSQKDDYFNVQEGVEGYKEAIKFLNDNPDLQTGFYKATAEGLKPKFLTKKDPRYTTLINLVNLAETPIRKKLYGAALTGTEIGLSQRSLLNTDDDRATVILKLNQGVNNFENALNRQLNETLGLPFTPKAALGGQTPANNSFLSDEDAYKEYLSISQGSTKSVTR